MCCPVAQLCLTLCDLTDSSTPNFPVLHHLPEFAQLMSNELVMPSDYLLFCCPLLLLSIFCPLLLLSIFPCITVFSNELAFHIKWPNYWSFSVSPSNEYSGLISFRMDWFDLLAVQRTLKSLLQHHTSKASILQFSVFFMVQLSHLYTATGKTIVLTSWTFVRKVMSLICCLDWS